MRLRFAARILRYAARRVIGHGVKTFFCISMHFRAFQVDWETLFFWKFSRNRSKEVKNFFCIFTRFRAFGVDWDTLFLFENFCERKARNASKRSEQDASAKPEGAKWPSSPAGLAGRSAERACKLVYIIKVALSVCLSVCISLAPTVLVQSTWNFTWTHLGSMGVTW